MQIHQIRNALREGIAAQMRGTADRLAAGRVSDYAEYRQVVGRIAGMKESIDIVEQVFNELLNEKEDSE